MNYTKTKFLYPVLLFLIGCSSQQFFDVKVINDEIEYFQGREVISREDNIVKSLLNYENQDGNCFVFYLQIENKSDVKYDVHPEQIFMQVNSEYNSDENASSVIYNYALDPERELQLIEQEMIERESDYTANTTTNCLFGLFSVVHDVSNDEDENDISYDWAGRMLDENIDYQNDLEELKAGKEFWQNEVLRITTLYPGERIGGLIFIPICPTSNRFSVIIPVAQTEHVYRFIQVKK